jgi:predicted ATPase
VDRWAFTHALVRDVLYQGLGAAERLAAHRRVAEALVAVHGDHEAHLAELAHHFVHAAGGDGRAVDYAVRAGRRALA